MASLRALAAGLLAIGVAWPAQVGAFSTDVHRWLAERALRGVVLAGPVQTPTTEDHIGFYLWLGNTLAARSDDAARDGKDAERFRARFPSARHFDAFGIRGFLGLSQEPTPAILGLDDIAPVGQVDRFNFAVDGAARPDVDRRNQNRFAYDAKRALRRDSRGEPLPADPVILNMGGLRGLGSQAHAHYQLAVENPSDDPEVLRTAPWNFVKATGFDGPVETSAAQMAQLHLDMAILALHWGEENGKPEAEYLALAWWGAGLHYVQDAAGPLHNVQVGAYGLFVHAKLLWWRRALASGGGFVGVLPTFVVYAQELIRAVHLFSEQWAARELEALRMGRPTAAALAHAWTQTAIDDPELAAALGDRLKPHLAGPYQVQPIDEGAGQILVHTLARLGAREGAPMYAAGLRAMSPLLRDCDARLGDDEPIRDDHVGDRSDGDVADALGEMATLHARSVRRATTATRLYWQALVEGSADAAARRLRRQRLDALDAGDRRLEAYVRAPPRPEAAYSERSPAILAGEVGAALALLGALAWWLRRRREGQG